MDEQHKKNALRHIDLAINYWNEKANGINAWWDKTRYEKSYCLEQVKYFENLKKQYI